MHKANTSKKGEVMAENKAHKNIQRHAYQITINNPIDYGYDHKKVKELLTMNFSTVSFFAMADEVGKQGTPHIHIYVCFSSRVRWSTLKRHFKEAHIEIAHGSVEDNILYIKKGGKWKDTDKEETKIEGSYEEWGEPPKQKGNNQDMAELYRLIKGGYTDSEIFEINNDYIREVDRINKIRTTLLIDKFKDTRRNVKVIYITGRTGTGKTRDVLDTHGDSNVYRVSDYDHPFDHYSCQPVICFDEFRSSLRMSDMLNYMDIYPIQLPSRYSNKVACYETVYIVSNWKLEMQYSEIQQHDRESWNAFLRRIHEIRAYNSDGTIDTYDSVQAYFDRDTTFHPVEKEEAEQLNLPFKDS